MALKSTDRRVDELEINKQDALVSAENIRTINGESLLGDGDIAVQQTLVSGTNIKTINGNSLLGSGDIVITPSSSITVGTTPITSGVDGRVLFQSGGVVSQDSGFTWDNTNKRLGVGTSTPTQRVEVLGNIRATANTGFAFIQSDKDSNYVRIGADGTSGFIQYGVLTTGTRPLLFIGNGSEVARFTPTGQLSIGATTAGARLDVRAQGALSTDIVGRYRNSADTANILTIAGNGTVWANGAGYVASNTAFGEGALDANTTGINNSSFGFNSLTSNTTGFNNSSFGEASLRSNTTGANNTAFGRQSLRDNTSASSNTAIGQNSLTFITTGVSNTAIGTASGLFIASGANNQTSSYSIYIGDSTRASANGNLNEIVIGYNATGLGSNTVVLGNTSIVTTQLRGTVRLSLQASAPTGVEGAIYYDSTTKKHYGHNGTNWNALY